VWPQSGQVRILPIDAAALRATASAVVAGVATWVDSRIEKQRASRDSVSGALSMSVDGALA
jgi:hypothetical protein